MSNTGNTVTLQSVLTEIATIDATRTKSVLGTNGKTEIARFVSYNADSRSVRVSTASGSLSIDEIPGSKYIVRLCTPYGNVYMESSKTALVSQSYCMEIKVESAVSAANLIVGFMFQSYNRDRLNF